MREIIVTDAFVFVTYTVRSACVTRSYGLIDIGCHLRPVIRCA